MLMTRTPLRISFFGGGTDFRSFYLREGGAVLATAVDKYIFVGVEKRSDSRVGLSHPGGSELVERAEDLRHDLARECLRKTGVVQGVEVRTLGDVTATGSGMGSSSAVIVGLLNALYLFSGQRRTPAQLAEEACEVEIDILSRPIGVQDQNIVSLGGFRHLTFGVDGTVRDCPLELEPDLLAELNRRLMLFHTNQSRRAESVLMEQQDRVETNRSVLGQMRDLVTEGISALRAGELDRFGALLNRNWELKKRLSSGVSNQRIDALYARAVAARALGGKVTGAGGGGFLLLYSPPDAQGAVRRAMQGLRELPFRFEAAGTSLHYPPSSV